MIFTLNLAHDATTLTINVNEVTAGAPASGYITIQGEIIRYVSLGTNSFNTCVRGQFTTTAATHAGNTFLSLYYDHEDEAIWVVPLSGQLGEYSPTISLALPTSQVAIQNMVIGSSWALVNRDTGQIKVSGVAATPDIVSDLYEFYAPYNGVVNVRKQGYIPLSFPVYVNSGLVSIYTVQSIDPIA